MGKRLALARGCHENKLVVGRKWHHDLHADKEVPNSEGLPDSVTERRAVKMPVQIRFAVHERVRRGIEATRRATIGITQFSHPARVSKEVPCRRCWNTPRDVSRVMPIPGRSRRRRISAAGTPIRTGPAAADGRGRSNSRPQRQRPLQAPPGVRGERAGIRTWETTEIDFIVRASVQAGNPHLETAITESCL